MQVKKQLFPGVVARELTVPEFYACVNYAISNQREYPLDKLGLSTELVDKYAVVGYNSLIDSTAFRIAEDGYPELTTNVLDIADLVIALDQMNSIITIRLSVSKHSLLFYFIHSEKTWTILWKRDKTSWIEVSSDFAVDPGTVLMMLATNSLAQRNNGVRVALKFTWFDMQGHEIALTEIASNKYGTFVEKEPASSLLKLNKPAWPGKYGEGTLGVRTSELLKVM